MRKILFLFFIFLSLTTITRAQDRYVWSTIDMNDGLPSDRVNVVFCDKSGNLWFGTDGGVAEFPQKKQHGLPSSTPWIYTFTAADGLGSNSIISIAQDRNGSLWFGTLDGGVSCFNGKTFQTFTTANGLANNNVLSIRADRHGQVWFGTRNGVSCYNGKKFRTYSTEDGLAKNEVRAILEDRVGVLWFGTYGGGVSSFDGQRFHTFTTSDGLASNDVQTIAQDNRGLFWFGTVGRGVSRYDGKKFQSFTLREGLADDDVRSIAQDRSGHLWFGTKGGVSYYDGEKFQNFITSDGLADSNVLSIASDSAGRLWFGTSSGGASRYGGKKFQSFNTKDSLTNGIVCSISQDSHGKPWFATMGRGVAFYDGKKFHSLTSQNGLVDNDVRTIALDDKGNLWFGTYGAGVSCYDGKEFQTFTTKDGLASDIVQVIARDPNGSLWFGTVGGGVSCYKNNKFYTFTSNERLADGDVQVITPDDAGNMWFGTSTGGVSCYDGKYFNTFTSSNGLANDNVSSIAQDRFGNLWFGTIDGASRFDGKKFITYTSKDGLANNDVRSILRDSAGNLWFGTFGGGVSCYDGKKFQTYTTNDGLPNGFVISSAQDRDGNLWFGTQGGGVGRYMNQVVSTVQSPLVYVKQVQFLLTSYGLASPTKLWSYRLDDAPWTSPSPESSIKLDYLRLRSGTHSLSLRLWNGWSTPPPTYVTSFEVSDAERNIALFTYALIFLLTLTTAIFSMKNGRASHVEVPKHFNPYGTGLPVGADLFTGRDDLVRPLLSKLHVNCFYLYGERRIGKTSLLHHIVRRLHESPNDDLLLIPVFVDLQGVPESQLWRFTLSKMQEAVQRLPAKDANGLQTFLPFGIPLHDREFSDFQFELVLGEWVKSLQPIFVEKVKFVILMDEVDTLNGYTLRTNLALRRLFTGELKNHFCCVMSGFALRMNWSDEDKGSPPFNYLSHIRLAGLSDAEARDLIRNPVEKAYTYSPDAVEHIVKISKRRPFVIQLLCQRVIDYILDQNYILNQNRRHVTLTDVESIQEMTLAEADNILQMGAEAHKLPNNMAEALDRIAALESELRRLREAARAQTKNLD